MLKKLVTSYGAMILIGLLIVFVMSYYRGHVNQVTLSEPVADNTVLEKESEPYNLVRDAIDENEMVSKSKELDAIDELSEELYLLPMDELGNLPVDDLVLNVSSELWESINLSFRMDELYDPCSVIVLSEENIFVSKHEVIGHEVTIEYGDRDVVEYIYKVQLSDLEPETTYHYCIKQNELYSNMYEFTTGSISLTTIGFYGDTQGYMKSQYEDFRRTVVMANETSSEPLVQYIAGDIVDNGHSMEEWGYFFESLSIDLSDHVWVSAIGNHDVKGSASAYINNFNYPQNGIESLENRCFYFDIPFGRVAVIDTESPSLFEEQQQWLVEVMIASNVENRLVLMHRSPYPLAYNEPYIRQWSKTFEEAAIDLVLSGHDHIYSRTSILNDRVVTVGEGVTYVCGGSSSGSKFYSPIDLDDRDWVTFYDLEKLPVFSLVEISEKGIRLEAYHVDGEEAVIFDTVELLIK